MKYLVTINGDRRAEFVLYSDAVNFCGQSCFAEMDYGIYDLMTGNVVHSRVSNTKGSVW